MAVAKPSDDYLTPTGNPNILPGEGPNAFPTPKAGAKPNGTREGNSVWWNGKLYSDPYVLANDLGYGAFQNNATQAQQFANFLNANKLLAWASYFTPGYAPKLAPGVDGLTQEVGGKLQVWFGGADGHWYDNGADLEDAIGLHGDQLKAWLTTQPAFSAFFAQQATTGGANTDGTVDANGGIWYKGALYADPESLKKQFPTDDAWREFLNTFPVFRDWNYKKASGQDTGTGTGTTPTPTGLTAGQQAGDPQSYLGMYGLPADVQAEVNRIFSNTTDLNQAVATAMAYIRGTPWYAKTYPGINEGIAKGLISNERDYRSYLNQTNQVYHQYAGRDIGSDEFAGFLREGASLSTIGGRLQGASYVKAFGNDTQYLDRNFGGGGLDDKQLQSFGEQQSGLGSDIGMLVSQRIQLASDRARKIFEGVLASPSLSLGSQGLNAPSLLGSNQKPDLQA